ncbi:MAG: hypothetical protein ACRCSO_03620 [Sphingomonas sp.]
MSAAASAEVAKGRAARTAGRFAEAAEFYRHGAALFAASGNPAASASALRHAVECAVDAGEAAGATADCATMLAWHEAHADGSLDADNARRVAARHAAAIGDIDRARQLWMQARDGYAARSITAGVEEAEQALALLG